MTQLPEHVDDELISLLRRLPELDPPRSFALGPRRHAEPPNVVRLRRWYTATRVGAAALAAAFVFLSAGVLYLDSNSRPVPTASVVARPQADAAGQSIQPTVAPRSALAPAVAVRPAQAPQADDQVAAATSVNPLLTPVPTPAPATPLAAPVSERVDPGAPLRLAAAAVGALAVLTLLGTAMVRQRLQHAASHP